MTINEPEGTLPGRPAGSKPDSSHPIWMGNSGDTIHILISIISPD